MKTSARSLLALAALLTTALAAPTPANGVSFPITDLLDKDLTVEEYAAQLENQSVEERGLTKRQYNGDTYNQLTDGTACRPITVIYARGTTQGTLDLKKNEHKTCADFDCVAGNVGEAGSEGPTFFNALASRVGGISRLAIQGVNYPANVVGFLAGGDAAGATTMFNLINQVSAAITTLTFIAMLTWHLGCHSLPFNQDRCLRILSGRTACTHCYPEAISCPSRACHRCCNIRRCRP